MHDNVIRPLVSNAASTVQQSITRNRGQPACRDRLRPAASAQGGLTPRRLRLVQNYIEGNLQGDLSLAAVASVAGLSRTYFCRAFRRTVGVSPHRYITSRRIERAKKLLSAGGAPIAEIALTVGFGDQSHLTTQFRRIAGTTPRRFRDQA